MCPATIGAAQHRVGHFTETFAAPTCYCHLLFQTKKFVHHLTFQFERL